MWHIAMRQIIARYSNPVCHLCGLTIERPIGETIWCSSCLTLFVAQPRCQRCGSITLLSVPHCGSCLANPPLWHNLYCVGDYQSPLSNYVHKLKYSGQLQLAYDLSYLLSTRIENPAPLLVSMPLHWRRLINRGYNQSDMLGYYLAYHLQNQIIFDQTVFKRTKATPSQQGLNKQQRVKNLRNAFSLSYTPNQKHIAIIDDVVTTGSSVRQLCKLLLDVGVEKIDIYCICRTET